MFKARGRATYCDTLGEIIVISLNLIVTIQQPIQNVGTYINKTVRNEYQGSIRKEPEKRNLKEPEGT